MRSSPRGGLVVEPLRCEKPGEPAAALSRRRRRILRQLFGGEELGKRAATRRRRRGLGGLPYSSLLREPPIVLPIVVSTPIASEVTPCSKFRSCCWLVVRPRSADRRH